MDITSALSQFNLQYNLQSQIGYPIEITFIAWFTEVVNTKSFTFCNDGKVMESGTSYFDKTEKEVTKEYAMNAVNELVSVVKETDKIGGSLGKDMEFVDLDDDKKPEWLETLTKYGLFDSKINKKENMGLDHVFILIKQGLNQIIVNPIQMP